MRYLVLTACAAALIISACGSTEENSEGSGASGAATTSSSGAANGGSGQGGDAMSGGGGTAGAGQGGSGQGGAGQGGGQGGGGVGGMGQAGAGGMGGAGQGCVDVTGDYGLCDLSLGWGFDGQHCTQFNGCNCAPNCMSFFMTLEECMNSCPGQCDTNAFTGIALAPNGWGPGQLCDDVTVCADANLQGVLSSFYPNLVCDPPGSGPCPASEAQCYLAFSGIVNNQSYNEYCSLTLIEDVDAVYCAVYP